MDRKKVINTSNIFKNAEKKLGSRINDTGKVSPKILKSILDDGAWCEEELQVEYFGGVLASSRTGISRDDRGAYYTTLISRLSTYQLRTHYLLYHIIKQLHNNKSVNIHNATTWPELEIFIPFETFYDAMDFIKDEEKNWLSIMSHCIWGLNKEELLSNFSWGNRDYMKQSFPQAETSGILFQPTKIGVELLMWAYGYGQLDPKQFFDPIIEFPNDQGIKIGQAISTKAAKEK